MKFKYCKSLILAVSMSSLLAACHPKPGPDAEETKSPVSTEEQPKEVVQKTSFGEIKMILIKRTDGIDPMLSSEDFKNALNRYAVAFHVPTNMQKSVTIVRRSNGESLKDLSTEYYPGANGELVYTDSCDYQKSKSYSPKIYSYEISYESELIASFKVEVKADLLIQGAQRVDQLDLAPGQQSFGVIYFDQDSRLVTQGQDYTLNADQLVTNDGIIESYTEDEANAPINARAAGRDGGKIVLNLKSAIGSLKVYMRGQRGAQGRTGEKGIDMNTPGANGRDENSSLKECVDPSSDVRKTPRDTLFVRDGCEIKKCISGPGDGENGPNGGNGEDGENGFNGGDSGTFYLRSKAADSLRVDVQLLPGLGGDPGKGAEGGKGGAGGKAGNSWICSAAKNGKDGMKGIDGRDGKPGLPGTIKKYCIQLSSNAHEECSQ